MYKFLIHVNTGDKNTYSKFHFVHKDHQRLSTPQQEVIFQQAVAELNRIYNLYGRFATKTAVEKLFKSYGFEKTKA